VPDRFLLDTSAIFALTDREAGADRVEALLDRAAAGECALHVCAASLMEIFYIALQEQGEDEAAQLVIAAAARLQEATLVHKDPEFAQLAGEVALESLPLKARR
jgi:predicted nucleic acid-binding protein